MPYTMMNTPAWLMGLPEGAIRIGVDIYNAVAKQSKDVERAIEAAWSAVKANYEKKDDGEWKAKQAAQEDERHEFIHFRAAQQTDEQGLVWEAILIVPGLSLGSPKFYWSEELLEASVDVFKGVDLNAYELTADFFSHLPIPNIELLEDTKRYLTSKKVGWIEKTWWEPGVGIKAEIHFLSDHAWLPKAILDGIDRGNDEVLGLSIDTRIKGMEMVIDNWTVIWPTQIVSCSSVDAVTHPAAGGKFLRAVAALDNNLTNRGKIMDREKLLNMIQEFRPELLKGKDRAALSDDDVLKLAQMAMQKAPEPKKKTETKPDQRAAQAVTPDQLDEAIKKFGTKIEQRAACGRMLDATLSESKLPEKTQARIRGSFEGKVFKQDELDARIKNEKDYLASMSDDDFDLEIGDQTRIAVGIGTIERAQMAVDRMFGLSADDMKEFVKMTRIDNQPFFTDMRAAQDYEKYDEVPVFGSIREMYTFFTGDPEVTGHFNRDGLPKDLRAAQAITSSTFSYILGNTLSRRLVKDYRALDFQENLLVSHRKPVKDFRPQEAVMVGYFGDLATVDPETADYAEIAAVTDEESTYSIGQKGNILTITRKTIINDDMTLIKRLVSRLGRAARRTHAKFVWNFFTANANCSDGTAWFTVGHGNLATAALSFATAITGYKALAQMTEKDSGEVIGLLDDPSVKPTLVYPVALMETGEKIVSDDHYFSANDLTTKTRNPLKGRINGAMISLLTDANDWGVLMPPSEVDMVEMGYLNGRQEPEMFVADTPQSEQVFVADKVRHKIRHEYSGAVVDYRSGYQSQVL